MGDKTGIEWTDATWNPVVGCSIVSPGCTNCYAMKMAHRLQLMGQPIYQGHTVMTKAGPVWNGKVEISNWGQVIKPLSWRRPRRIFVNSMSDLFHEHLPDEVRDTVFAVMANCPQHTFQVLTKRAEVMQRYLSDPDRLDAIYTQWHSVSGSPREAEAWPLPNVWVGVSVEDQKRADERIPDLLATPAAKRFLSCEPLLGPVRLWWEDVDEGRLTGPAVRRDGGVTVGTADDPSEGYDSSFVDIDWIIVGGESGPGARPANPQWFRDLRDQCAAADVPYFFKQNGDWVSVSEIEGPGEIYEFPDGRCVRRVGKKKAGNTLDGRRHMEFPA